MSRFDQARSGWSDREDRTTRPGRPPGHHGNSGDAGSPPGMSSPANKRLPARPAVPSDVAEPGHARDQHTDGLTPPPYRRPAGDTEARAAHTTAGIPNQTDSVQRRSPGVPMPRGWPRKRAALWASLTQPRPPLSILVGGAEGGVGTSTVTALLAEMTAAVSPGPTIAVDQCGTVWGSLTRRLVGQQAGLRAELARTLLAEQVDPHEVASMAPTTSAGAALIDDRAGYTPLHDLLRLVSVTSGAMIVDAGRVDSVFAARLVLQPVVVVVGRADVIGAEATCAAVTFLREQTTRARLPAQPIVVLSSAGGTGSSTERRRSQAAATLVTATGIDHLVHLPHDPRLATGRPLRLDQVGKSTAIAGIRMASAIGRIQGEICRANRRSASPAAVPGPGAR